MKNAAIALVPAIVISLAGTPAYAQTGAIRGTVTDADGTTLPGAQIAVQGTDVGTSANNNGNYAIEDIEPGTYTLRATFVGYGDNLADVTVRAGEVTEQDFELTKGSISLEEAVIVGSRTGTQAAGNRPVPVDVLSATEIEGTGKMETAQILQNLAPSVNFPHQSVSDGTDIVRPFTLRGLSPDHTLVLINGKRRHRTALVNVYGSGGVGGGSSGVDLNAIPSSAISRIEVLRDGAAAQYGSDAIAGVVNVILKEGKSPLALSVQTGQYVPNEFENDGFTIDASSNYGFSIGEGTMNLSLEYRNRQPTNRAGADSRDQIVEGDADVVNEDNEVVEKNNPVEQPNHHWGDGFAKLFMGFLNARYPLQEEGDAELYAFGGATYREGRSQGFRRRALDSRNWPQIYPKGYLPQFGPNVFDLSGVVGAEGAFQKWNYDLSGSYGRNDYKFNMQHTLNVSLGPDIPPNQTSFFAGKLSLQEAVANLDLTRSYDVGLPDPLGVAVGASFRLDHYSQTAGERASWVDGEHPNQYGNRSIPASQVFPGFRPSDAGEDSRTNVAVYADVETSPLEPLLIDAAARFENYSDFGQTVTGKLAVRLLPTDWLTLRSSISNGFRAPALSQSIYSATSTNFEEDPETGETVPVEEGIYPVDSEVSQRLGAEPLEEATSTNLSAGLSVSPISSFALAVDYFLINVHNRITLSNDLSGPTVKDILSDLLATRGSYFSNAIDTRNQGVDVTADYNILLSGKNIFRFSGSFNYTHVDITNVIDNPPELEGLDTEVFSAEEGLTYQDRPEMRGNLTARYERGDRFHALIRGSYYDGFRSALWVEPQSYGDKFLTDVEVGYQFIDEMKLSIGANNIFDIFPDRMNERNQIFDVFQYPRASPFGFNGREIYARATVTL